jgi:hypothetical protein
MPKKLSIKQEAVIADVLKTVKEGGKLSVSKSTEKIYDVKSRAIAQSISSQNLAIPEFRQALLNGLEERQILGANSRVEGRLAEGLDAEDDRGNLDRKTILEYIKEINKVAGVYAPEQRESKHLRLNMNMSKEEVADKIKSLQGELEDV